jgi:hypothetical protein
LGKLRSGFGWRAGRLGCGLGLGLGHSFPPSRASIVGAHGQYRDSVIQALGRSRHLLLFSLRPMLGTKQGRSSLAQPRCRVSIPKLRCSYHNDERSASRSGLRLCRYRTAYHCAGQRTRTGNNWVERCRANCLSSRRPLVVTRFVERLFCVRDSRRLRIGQSPVRLPIHTRSKTSSRPSRSPHCWG